MSYKVKIGFKIGCFIFWSIPIVTTILLLSYAIGNHRITLGSTIISIVIVGFILAVLVGFGDRNSGLRM